MLKASSVKCFSLRAILSFYHLELKKWGETSQIPERDKISKIQPNLKLRTFEILLHKSRNESQMKAGFYDHKFSFLVSAKFF